jgi:membrane protease YdiL (CAAX protease family)
MNRLRTWLAAVNLPDAAPPWSLTSAAIAVVFAFVAMIIGVFVAIAWVGEKPDYYTLAGPALGGILIIAFVWQTRRRDWNALRLSTSPTPLLFVMFVSFGCALALDLIGLALTRSFAPAPELQYLNVNALSVIHWVLAITFMVIVQPIAEGLVFRGILLPALRKRLSGWRSVYWAALIAGGFHMVVHPMDYTSLLTPLWYGLIAPIIAAVLFGAVRASSKSTRAAIAAQVAFGLFAIVKLVTLTGAG